MWEYKVVPVLMALYSEGFPFSSSEPKTINSLGEQGWELVEIIEIGNGEHVAYFKRKLDGRPKIQKSDESETDTGHIGEKDKDTNTSASAETVQDGGRTS